MELIHSGPTFRFGVIGFLLLFCGLLFGFFFSPLVFILTVPGVSLLLSRKRIQFNTVTMNIEVISYMLIFPETEFWGRDKMANIFLDYIWENENKSRFRNGQISYQLGDQYDTFSRSFELQFRDQSGNKLPITDYTDYRAARKAAERLAQITGLPLVDEYFEIQSQAVQRRKASGRR
jgi:hypothetical protein